MHLFHCNITELTDILKRGYEVTEKFYICFKKFSFEKRKVRDNCHYAGLYRGAANSGCNLKYRIPDNILIVLHNLICYNIHLFNKELAKKFSRDYTGLIVANKEKYTTFNVKINIQLAGVTNKDLKEVRKNVQLRFLESCISMTTGLDKLANILYDTSGIQCDICIGDMELIHISSKYWSVRYSKQKRPQI